MKDLATFIGRIIFLLIMFLINIINKLRFMFGMMSAKKFFDGQHRLMAQAIERNDMEKLKKLAQGQDLSLKGKEDMDLMWFAIYHKNFDAIRTLVELGVDPEKQPAQGIGTALDFCFMQHEDTRYLEAMLDGGLSPNYDYGGYTMLQRGVFGGLEHVKLLLQRGTRINDQDSIGRTALYRATNIMAPDIAIYLVQQGADFNAYTSIGVTPAWSTYIEINDGQPGHPIHNKFLDLRDLMIEKGCKWPPDSPPDVRDQMRARGETPVVPPNVAR